MQWCELALLAAGVLLVALWEIFERTDAFHEEMFLFSHGIDSQNLSL